MKIRQGLWGFIALCIAILTPIILYILSDSSSQSNDNEQANQSDQSNKYIIPSTGVELTKEEMETLGLDPKKFKIK